MDTVTFEEFYNTNLASKIDEMEEGRVKQRNIFIVWQVIITLVVGGLGLLILKASEDGDVIKLIIFAYAALTAWNKKRFDPYIKNFKNNVMDKIVKYIDGELIYSPTVKNQENIGNVIVKSNLILDCKNRSGNYKIEDELIKPNLFEACEVYYQVGNGRNKRTNFRGLLFNTEFNKQFDGETYVFSSKARFSNERKVKIEKVTLENLEFNNIFKTKATNQVTSRYILSSSMMERLVDFQKKSNKKIHLSFIDSKMYMTIENKKDLFEPKLLTKTDYTTLQIYYDAIKLITDIREELKLNINIWKA